MDICDKYFDTNGNAVDLGEKAKKQLINEIVVNKFACNAFRTLLVAYTDLTMRQYEVMKADNNNFQKEDDREILESGLTAIGIYALMDPLRTEIVHSVKVCHEAGINVRMVTGDNIDTAKAIAINAGILDPAKANNQYACMTGKEFREECGGLKKLEDPNDRGLLKEEIGNKYVFK